MISYNVSLRVDADAAAAWLLWMEEEHMPKVMETGCFTSCQLFRLRTDTDDLDPSPTFVAQYEAPDAAAYERYVSEHADRLRQESNERFGGKFVAFRTVMERAIFLQQR